MKILYALAICLLLAGKCTAQNYAAQLKADSSSHTLIEITFHCNKDSVYCFHGDLPPALFTSRIIKYKLTAGEYTFKFFKKGFAPVIEKIIISSSLSLAIDLKKSKEEFLSEFNLSGMVSITSEPAEAMITVNGKKIGKTPYQGELAFGRYKIKVDKSEFYYPIEEEINLAPDEKKSINYELKPRLGSLSIYVDPVEAGNAEVYLDEQLKGNAPLVFAVKIGEHLVKVSKKGFAEQTRGCMVSENNKIPLRFVLNKYIDPGKQSANIWGTVKWIGIGTAALSGAAAAYFKISADKNYRYFQKATSPADIAHFRNKVQSHDSLYRTSLYTGIAALGSAWISWMIQSAQ